MIPQLISAFIAGLCGGVSLIHLIEHDWKRGLLGLALMALNLYFAFQ